MGHIVRLGNSGLKVSKIILGTMQYGSSAWQDWVLEEEEATKHIKYAYARDISTCMATRVLTLRCDLQL